MRKAFVLMLALLVMLVALPLLASACTACDSAPHALFRASEVVVTSMTHVAPALAKMGGYQAIAPGGVIGYTVIDMSLITFLIDNKIASVECRVGTSIPYARDAPCLSGGNALVKTTA